MNKMIGYLLSIGALVGMLWSVYQYVDDRYAKAADVKSIQETIQKLHERLDQKILSDQIDHKQERIWQLEDRYADEKKRPQSTKEEIRQLQQDIDSMKEELHRWENGHK